MYPSVVYTRSRLYTGHLLRFRHEICERRLGKASRGRPVETLMDRMHLSLEVRFIGGDNVSSARLVGRQAGFPCFATFKFRE